MEGQGTADEDWLLGADEATVSDDVKTFAEAVCRGRRLAKDGNGAVAD